MGKRKRGRSVKRNTNSKVEPEEFVQAPHSFVIHRGIPGDHILELTKDFRRVMEPFTATSLKERKKNTIKDFVSVAAPLHVSYLSIFSRTEIGMYLKIIRLPRGPTLTFKVQNFSLARDVVSALKKQVVVEKAFKHSPLIVMNSFSGEGMQMKLMTSMFQNMFPNINITTVNLDTVRRCVLLSYNPSTKLIDFRHYNIKVVPVGVSKGVKKVIQGKVPDLSKCDDIAEFFSKAGMMSESEAEDDPKNHVTLTQKIASRGNVESGKSAIKLSELGPRLTLKLVKIEDGLLDGEVLFHDLIFKSEEEKEEIQRRREEKRKLKETRKKQQEINKKKKDAEKLSADKKSKQKHNENLPEGANVEDDDREYYKNVVGEEPEKDLFSARTGVKRKFNKSIYPNQKKRKIVKNNTRRPEQKTFSKKSKTNKQKRNKLKS